MKFLILLPAVLGFSELHTAAAFSKAAIQTYGCGDFLKSSGVSNYDKFCYSSNVNGQVYCIGNEGLEYKVECTDTTVDTIHKGINFVFDLEKYSPMHFNKQDENNCQNYHLASLENLAWSLGYSNYTVNVKQPSNGCRFVALDISGDLQTIMEGGKPASSVVAAYDVTFWGSLEGEREKLSGGKACDSLDNVPCSTCAKYLDGKKRRKALESEDAKCVWLPEINGCKTKAFAEKKRKDYVENCPEKDPKDDCSKYDGISHIKRSVCCNKKCPGCGGVQGDCGKLTDKDGQILGASECCGKRIEDSGITCGVNGRKAPCVLSSPR